MVNTLKMEIKQYRLGLTLLWSQVYAHCSTYITILDASVVVNKVIEAEDVNYGYDAMEGTYVNMIEEGIIDPTKVSSLN